MYHTLDICQDIADKLRDPDKVCEITHESVKRGKFLSEEWPELSLAESLPGIITFYGTIHELFPDQHWDRVAHEYLKRMVEKIHEQRISNHSLFEGLTGICFAIYICSQKEIHYPSLLSSSEQLLFTDIETNLFPRIDHLLESDQDAIPHVYNLTHGLSGIIAYLLVRKENFACPRLASACLYRLVRILTRRRTVNGHSVPGWHVSQNEQLTAENRGNYPNGNFILSLPDGILGCLSILSIAALEGMIIPGQYEIIQEITTWLKGKQGIGHATWGTYWHHTFSFEEEISNTQETIAVARNMWNYGTPAVSRSLYLAARAMKDHALQNFAEEAFISVFSKPWQEWNILGPTFSTGRAGLLALTSAMSKETQHCLLVKQVEDLSRDLKRFYSPSHPFGFQTVGVDASEQYHWIDHPGLLNGSVGVVLSLLYGHYQQEMDWCRIFLIR